ncbi:MAG: hypothetical protein QW035_01655 [Candidatus Anstonellales archaeon]
MRKNKTPDIFMPKNKKVKNEVLEEDIYEWRLSVKELSGPLKNFFSKGRMDLDLLVSCLKNTDMAIRVDALWLTKRLIDKKKIEDPLQFAKMLRDMEVPKNCLEPFQAALYIYGKVGGKEHLKIIEEALQHKNYFIRMEAKRAISMMKRRKII